MKRTLPLKLGLLLVGLAVGASATAAITTQGFAIEGLISPASPKVLISQLEAQLQVKVIDLNLKNTESGWPVLSVEYDSSQLSTNAIEKTIASIEDPAGHKYRVHTGPPTSNAAYTEEEQSAIAKFGPAAPDISAVVNPVQATDESIMQGKALFDNYCTTCHGLNGGGNGPAAHGITTFPRQLWVWNNTNSSTDGYLFWFITNGRNEMPPWGVILSEKERWDVINYIKTLENPL